jgi:hypothetical protein
MQEMLCSGCWKCDEKRACSKSMSYTLSIRNNDLSNACFCPRTSGSTYLRPRNTRPSYGCSRQSSGLSTLDSPPPPQSETPAPVPLAQSTFLVPAAASQVQHVEPRGLAQPVGGTWAKKRNNAILEAQSIKTLKVQQHEMDEQQKRTCMLVVYHTVRVLFYLFCDFTDNTLNHRTESHRYDSFTMSNPSPTFVFLLQNSSSKI